MRRRRFTPEFKRSIIEQLLSEAASPAELCRRYNVSSGLLFTWKKHYAQGKLDSDPSREAELQARVRDLEQMLGKLSLENEFLKKALRNSLKQSETKSSSSPKTAASYAALKGGAN
jgi:transposase